VQRRPDPINMGNTTTSMATTSTPATSSASAPSSLAMSLQLQRLRGSRHHPAPFIEVIPSAQSIDPLPGASAATSSGSAPPPAALTVFPADPSCTGSSALVSPLQPPARPGAMATAQPWPVPDPGTNASSFTAPPPRLRYTSVNAMQRALISGELQFIREFAEKQLKRTHRQLRKAYANSNTAERDIGVRRRTSAADPANDREHLPQPIITTGRAHTRTATASTTPTSSAATGALVPNRHLCASSPRRREVVAEYADHRDEVGLARKRQRSAHQHALSTSEAAARYQSQTVLSSASSPTMTFTPGAITPTTTSTVAHDSDRLARTDAAALYQLASGADALSDGYSPAAVQQLQQSAAGAHSQLRVQLSELREREADLRRQLGHPQRPSDSHMTYTPPNTLPRGDSHDSTYSDILTHSFTHSNTSPTNVLNTTNASLAARAIDANTSTGMPSAITASAYHLSSNSSSSSSNSSASAPVSAAPRWEAVERGCVSAVHSEGQLPAGRPGGSHTAVLYTSASVSALPSGGAHGAIAMTGLAVPPAGNQQAGSKSYSDSKPKTGKGSRKQAKAERVLATGPNPEELTVSDGWKWRKYGRKKIRDARFPRHYYRCTTTKCPARRFTQVVERSAQEFDLVVRYVNEHNHAPSLHARNAGHHLHTASLPHTDHLSIQHATLSATRPPPPHAPLLPLQPPHAPQQPQQNESRPFYLPSVAAAELHRMDQ
jgi:WRKY DNA -binding domain